MSMDVYWRFVAALILVLAMIFAVAWVARRFGVGGRLAAVGGKKRRLAVVEVLPLDGKRRLVLLRRDGVEHLVLVGLGAELLIEAGIRSEPSGDFAAALQGTGV